MNKLLSIVLLFSAFSALAISPEAVLHGVCDRDRALYACGEEMSFTIALEGCGADYTGEGHFVSWKRTGDDGKTESGKIPAAELLAKPFVYKTSLDRPGFVWFYSILQNEKGQRVEATLENGRKRSFEFSGSAGVEIETLESVPEPDDFDAFWTKRRARLAKTPMTAKLTEGECETEGMKAYVVEVACAGPRPVTGYLTVPTDVSKKYPVLVQFEGYGVTRPYAPKCPPSGRISFYVTSHGFEFGREPEYYQEFWKSIMSANHTFAMDPQENSDPERAYFSGMTYRIMRALE
ncbi:MAG: acetylxylan esterase [Kiritimatiellae bacterium]|nr:acetylxylan esterase [Kiritimatiellia bacterium]